MSAFQKIRRLDILISGRNSDFWKPYCSKRSQTELAWSDICVLLATRLRPHVTSLCIYFSTIGASDVERQISQLRAVKMPALRHLSFSASWDRALEVFDKRTAWNESIQSIYRSAAAELVKPQLSVNTFPIQRLPTELQDLILSHTGLKQPSRKRNPIISEAFSEGQIALNEGLVPDCCGSCDSRMGKCLCIKPWNFSTSCTCTLRQVLLGRKGSFRGHGAEVVREARRLYLSLNRFVIFVRDDMDAWNDLPCSKLDLADAKSTLERIPSDCRWWVKNISINYQRYAVVDQPLKESWSDLICWISLTFLNPRLLVTIIIAPSPWTIQQIEDDKRLAFVIAGLLAESTICLAEVILVCASGDGDGKSQTEQRVFSQGISESYGVENA